MRRAYVSESPRFTTFASTRSTTHAPAHYRNRASAHSTSTWATGSIASAWAYARLLRREMAALFVLLAGRDAVTELG